VEGGAISVTLQFKLSKSLHCWLFDWLQITFRSGCRRLTMKASRGTLEKETKSPAAAQPITSHCPESWKWVTCLWDRLPVTKLQTSHKRPTAWGVQMDVRCVSALLVGIRVVIIKVSKFPKIEA